jgi:hypothetical protein
MMVRSEAALMNRNGRRGELGRSVELKVAEEDKGAWID